MSTPFDAAIAAVKTAGYHNHRHETHSDVVSRGIYDDLLRTCDALRQDVDAGVVRMWENVASPGDRQRKVDLFIGEPGPDGGPVIEKVRIAVENKSVITAHRNRTNRFDDLTKVLSAVHAARPEALLVATVLVGVAPRVLNVPDRIHPMYRGRDEDFSREVLQRLSRGDELLWRDFSYAVSANRPNEPLRTVAEFDRLPTRSPGLTHVKGFDFVLQVPVFVDNVNVPYVARDSVLGIDVDGDYDRMLKQLCSGYRARWHS